MGDKGMIDSACRSSVSWPDFNAEHDLRYTGNEIFLFFMMSNTSVVAEGLYGLMVGVSVPKIRLPIHVLSLKFAGHQEPKCPVETGGQVRFNQWAGRRKVCCKDQQ